jgi:hypothetical protein
VFRKLARISTHGAFLTLGRLPPPALLMSLTTILVTRLRASIRNRACWSLPNRLESPINANTSELGLGQRPAYLLPVRQAICRMA